MPTGQDSKVAESRTEARPRLKPRGLKPRVLKLINVLRLLSLGRHRRRASSSSRQAARRIAEPLTDAEEAFLGKVLSFVPLMARTSKLLRPFLDGECVDDINLRKLAARTIHQAKVMTTRTVWKDLVEPLKEEINTSKHRHTNLQDQFNEARSEFLREIAALRDEARVRGDPAKMLEQSGQLKDVMFFFEPMKTLQPHELQYCLEVIKEKLKMIFEGNASVTQTVNFGQIERLKELLVSSEVAKQKDLLLKKAAEILELEKERRHLQRELAIASKMGREARFGAESACVASENVLATVSAESEQLRAEVEQLKETSSRKEAMMKKVSEQMRKLQHERDNALKGVQENQDYSKELQDKLNQVEAEKNTTSQVLLNTRRELQLLEGREMILNEQLERQRVYGETLIHENEALRKTLARWQERRRSQLENEIKPFWERDGALADPEVEATELGDPKPEPDIPLEANELIIQLRQSDEQLQAAMTTQTQMSTRMFDLELENRQLRQLLEQQAQQAVQHGAALEQQHAESLAGILQRLTGTRKKDLGKQKTQPWDVHSTPQEPLFQLSPKSRAAKLDEDSKRPVFALPSEDSSAQGANHAQASRHEDREKLGDRAASAVTTMQGRLQKLRTLTTALHLSLEGGAHPSESGGDGSYEGGFPSPSSSAAASAREAALAAQELHEELDGMCEVTTCVANALKSSVEEMAQTRAAVAMMSDQVQMAEAALKSSPALQSDEQLQRCLLKMEGLKSSTLVTEVTGVFGRLWADSIDRQARRFRRPQEHVASMAPPVYVLSADSAASDAPTKRHSMPNIAEASGPPGIPSMPSTALPSPGVPSSARSSRDLIVESRRPSKSPSPSPSLVATTMELPLDTRRPSKTPSQPDRNELLPPASRLNSKRRASAPEVSWSEARAASKPLPPGSAGSALIIRAVSPSPSVRSQNPEEASDVDVDDLAILPQAPSFPRKLPRSPRPSSAVRCKPSDRDDASDVEDMDDPLSQARARPRTVPPLTAAGPKGDPCGQRATSKTSSRDHRPGQAKLLVGCS
ncbi:unnamed protein product [Effrenium voratum]|uniref:Uncharacterized protein n=1 Tax=Effrenium voratum TaxID=2562239 RepID=A0AA36NHI8_9DINO|nr:unnamed protein product [Effrenium voratum]CAJ1443466.1 unnamed protein product [Effrenium voratum]